MSTDNRNTSLTPAPVKPPLSLRELTILLIQHYGIHRGSYDLLIEFQIGMGAVGPNPASLAPGAMIGVSRVGLVMAKETGPSSVDAGLVNPARPTENTDSKLVRKKPVAKKPATKKKLEA